MRVRDLVSNTSHSIYGPLSFGFIRDISPAHYVPDIFEIIPQCAGDVAVSCLDRFGRMLSDDRIAALKKKKFAEFNKTLRQQYEEENKLAIERMKGRT